MKLLNQKLLNQKLYDMLSRNCFELEAEVKNLEDPQVERVFQDLIKFFNSPRKSEIVKKSCTKSLPRRISSEQRHLYIDQIRSTIESCATRTEAARKLNISIERLSYMTSTWNELKNVKSKKW